MSAPSAPITDIWPSCSDSQIRFFWRTPASDGGSPITKYTVECAAISYSEDISSNRLDHLVTGLTNATEYAFTVTATNINGASEVATFPVVQPGVLPYGPATAAASTMSATTALVTWEASTIANEGLVKWYIIEGKPSSVSMSSFYKTEYPHLSSAVIENLSTNIYYDFLVRGINDTGYCEPRTSTATLYMSTI